MSSNSLIPAVNSSSTWLHRWIYYLASGFMFAAAALRAFLVFQQSFLLDQILLLWGAPVNVGFGLLGGWIGRVIFNPNRGLERSKEKLKHLYRKRIGSGWLRQFGWQASG